MQQPPEGRCDLGGENIALLGSRARGADALDERLLRFTNLRGVLGLLQRRRTVVRLLAELDVFVDARLEVREHSRVRIGRRFLRENR